MKLVFYAQVKADPTKADYLMVVKTTKTPPTGPEGQVIKFNVDIPEAVFMPEVRASLVSLETVTDQAVADLRASAKALKQ